MALPGEVILAGKRSFCAVLGRFAVRTRALCAILKKTPAGGKAGPCRGSTAFCGTAAAEHGSAAQYPEVRLRSPVRARPCRRGGGGRFI